MSYDANQLSSEALKWSWLPNERIARLWTQYSKDSAVPDETPPPAPTKAVLDGEILVWECEADLESGLACFVIELDGKEIARVPEKSNNPFGRPVFQGLQYSDTPPQPLAQMRLSIPKNAESRSDSSSQKWTIHSVNTVGRASSKAIVSKR